MAIRILAAGLFLMLTLNLGVKGQEGTDHIKDCLVYINCGENVEEEYAKRNEENLAKVLEEDVVGLLDGMKNSNMHEFSSQAMDEVMAEFCAMDSDKQDEVLTDALTIGLEIYTEACLTPTEASKCSRYDDLTKVGDEILDEMHEAGLC